MPRTPSSSPAGTARVRFVVAPTDWGEVARNLRASHPQLCSDVDRALQSGATARQVLQAVNDAVQEMPDLTPASRRCARLGVLAHLLEVDPDFRRELERAGR